MNADRSRMADDRRAQSHAEAWVQLWREAPAVVKEDVIYLIAATPSLIIVWLAIWFATPA